MVKIITPSDAQERLMSVCSRYETCSYRALQKMQQWQIAPDEQQKILQVLVNQRFIDDLRYAKSFARGKSARDKWGVRKIKDHLRLRRISADVIDEALQEVDADNEPATLEKMLRKKMSLVKPSATGGGIAPKLLRFAVNKGYDYATAIAVVKKITNEKCYD
jgi:regulatory protein